MNTADIDINTLDKHLNGLYPVCKLIIDLIWWVWFLSHHFLKSHSVGSSQFQWTKNVIFNYLNGMQIQLYL